MINQTDGPSEQKRPISILFLAAEPSNEVRLRLGQEVREIEETIRLLRYRDRFVMHQRHAIRPGDFTQAMLNLEPQIVHFSGHGSGIQGLCFEGADGLTHLVAAPTLSALFREFAGSVKCVVLNACFSEVQAKQIVRHINFVIGMTETIGDASAISFSKGFYQALGAGKNFEDAYRLGCLQIRLISGNLDESQTPVLKVKNEKRKFK